MKLVVPHNWCNGRFINTQRKGHPGSPHINQKNKPMLLQHVILSISIQTPRHFQNPPNIILDHSICDLSLW